MIINFQPLTINEEFNQHIIQTDTSVLCTGHCYWICVSQTLIKY